MMITQNHLKIGKQSGKNLKYSILLFCYLLLSNVHAEEIFPPKCQPVVISDEIVPLSTTKPTVIMIHNLSTTELWLTHPSQEGRANAGWSSRVQSDNWSALALDRKKFTLNCIESRPGHEQQIPCKEVVAVCQMQDVTVPEHLSGTFWAGENMAMAPLIAYIKRRGYIL